MMMSLERAADHKLFILRALIGFMSNNYCTFVPLMEAVLSAIGEFGRCLGIA